MISCSAHRTIFLIIQIRKILDWNTNLGKDLFSLTALWISTQKITQNVFIRTQTRIWTPVYWLIIKLWLLAQILETNYKTLFLLDFLKIALYTIYTMGIIVIRIISICSSKISRIVNQVHLEMRYYMKPMLYLKTVSQNSLDCTPKAKEITIYSERELFRMFF